jgi:hypothetical protein
MGYVPGAQVNAKRPRTLRAKKERTTQGRTWGDLPVEIIDNILMILAEDRSNRFWSSMALMRMCMVNRSWRETVQNNLKAWYLLYRHWRGPVTDKANELTLQRGRGLVVRLNPTIPRSLPNFKDKLPSAS